MPMIPQAVVAMFGCARLGAVHSVVFGGFAAAELAKRINDCKPKRLLARLAGMSPAALSNTSRFSMRRLKWRITSRRIALYINARP